MTEGTEGTRASCNLLSEYVDAAPAVACDEPAPVIEHDTGTHACDRTRDNYTNRFLHSTSMCDRTCGALTCMCDEHRNPPIVEHTAEVTHAVAHAAATPVSKYAGAPTGSASILEPGTPMWSQPLQQMGGPWHIVCIQGGFGFTNHPLLGFSFHMTFLALLSMWALEGRVVRGKFRRKADLACSSFMIVTA